MVGWITATASLATLPALLAVSWPYLARDTTAPGLDLSAASVQQTIHDLLFPPPEYACGNHSYTTQIVSVDPLVIYIHDFLSAADTAALLRASEHAFRPSYITLGGRTQLNPDRTSHSAFLPADDPATRCVADRARRFAGALMRPAPRDEMGVPQLVRYTAGQRYNLHWDWYPAAQRAPAEDGRAARAWNRAASFFAILEDGCEGGETWFPQVRAASGEGDDEVNGLWRRHEDGGTAFRPVMGNALFWVNLQAGGTGDKRVKHAGLPVRSGRKTAMNIWPRRYFD